MTCRAAPNLPVLLGPQQLKFRELLFGHQSGCDQFFEPPFELVGRDPVFFHQGFVIHAGMDIINELMRAYVTLFRQGCSSSALSLCRSVVKCRAGFMSEGGRGRYYLFDHFAFVPRRDGPFYAAAFLLAAILLGLEWLCASC